MSDGIRLKRDTGARLTMDDLDHNFNLLSQGGGLISASHSDWLITQGAQGLPSGGNIFVNDKCDLGMIVFCDAVDEFNVNAIGGFLVADYGAIGTHSSDIKGVWYENMEIRVLQYTYQTQVYFNVVDGSNFNNGDLVHTDNSTGFVISNGNNQIRCAIISGDPTGDALITDDTTVVTTDVNSIDPISNPTFTIGENLYSDNGASATILTDDTFGNATVKVTDGNFSIATRVLGNTSTTSAAIVSLGGSSLTNGNIVIYNGIHYIVIDDRFQDTSSPPYNSNAYSGLEKTIENGYIQNWDDIEYSFDTDEIFWRRDRYGNKISYYSDNVDSFQWGDPNIRDCILNTYEAFIVTSNNRGEITGIQSGWSAFIYLPNNSGSIYFDVNGTNQNFYAPDNSGTIEGHLRGFNSGIEAENNTGDIKIYVEDSSYFYARNNQGDIYATYLNNSFVSHYNNAGDIMHCKFDSFSTQNSYSVLSLYEGISHFECEYSNNLDTFTFDASTSYSNKKITNTESTFDVNLYLDEVLSSNILDLSGWGYCGIFNFRQMCLIKGTKILLSNGAYKNIEDVNYSDILMVWNFDSGKMDVAHPLWIKIPQATNKYNLLKFSDGSYLKTIDQHRIFNKEKGMFTYTMTEDTPIGTTTFNSNEEEITLISKEIINDEAEYYNIITERHINLFSNNILTSCRFNNIYPIKDMKFIKDDRNMRSLEEFGDVDIKYFNGLRLSEQTFSREEINMYITKLIRAGSFETTGIWI